MTTYLSAHLALTADTELPECRLVDMGSGIPIVRWGDLTISLGLLTDPATYLREWAHSLNALAAEVDAAADQRQPSGYVAPVVAGGAS